MNPLNPATSALLDQLARELPQLRADHPDDFWPQLHQRCDKILEHTPEDQRVLAQGRIEELLIAHNLGPADPGA